MANRTSLLPVLCISLLLTACASKPTLICTSDPITAGATHRERDALGYTLRNDLLQLTLDPATGDVVYFGAPTGSESFFTPTPDHHALSIRIAGHEQTATDGYVEPRDEQTWQYIGDDSLLRWRKIYNLDHNRIIATFLVQNITSQPITFELILAGTPAAEWTASSAGPELTTLTRPMPGPANQSVEFRGFVIHPDAARPLTGPQLLRSDSFTLQPQERISFTTEWTYRAMAPVPEIPAATQPAANTPNPSVPQ